MLTIQSREAVNEELDRLDAKGINMTEEETRRYRRVIPLRIVCLLHIGVMSITDGWVADLFIRWQSELIVLVKYAFRELSLFDGINSSSY